MSILNLIFPDFCLGCGRIGAMICEECLSNLKLSAQLSCSSECEADLFDSLYFCFDFDKEELIRRLVYQFKYQFSVEIGAILGKLMVRFWRKFVLKDYIIIPMPVSNKSLKEREFNQSYLLARKISRAYDYDLFDCLFHLYEHENQMTLSRQERLLNLKGAISVREEVSRFLEGKIILLIDDIATTCASLNECSRVLRGCGVKTIECLVLARAGMS